MTVEKQRQVQHKSGKEHMDEATANALRLIKLWQTEKKLTPDTGRLTRSQVPEGATYSAVDDPKETARANYGMPLNGEIKF